MNSNSMGTREWFERRFCAFLVIVLIITYCLTTFETTKHSQMYFGGYHQNDSSKPSANK